MTESVKIRVFSCQVSFLPLNSLPNIQVKDFIFNDIYFN